MKCPSCGGEINGTKFCPYCGSAAPVEKGSTTLNDNASQTIINNYYYQTPPEISFDKIGAGASGVYSNHISEKKVKLAKDEPNEQHVQASVTESRPYYETPNTDDDSNREEEMNYNQAQQNLSQSKVVDDRKMTTLILCIFLGHLGVHHFYNGKTGAGFLYLFTVGFCGVGWIIDIIRIATDNYPLK